MRIVKVGDKSKAICKHCESLVETTFQIREVPISGKGISATILAGVCDQCDNTVSIPHQSSQVIKNTLNI